MEALSTTTKPAVREGVTRPPSPVSRPALPKAFDGEFRRLHPLKETLQGLPVYGNTEGKKFTVRTVLYDQGLVYPTAHVEIKEVGGTQQESYRVLATIVVYKESVDIEDIRNNGLSIHVPLYEAPAEDKRGYGFFGIILERTKQIAAEAGRRPIEICPANKLLGAHYERFGFETVPDSHTGRMRLELAAN